MAVEVERLVIALEARLDKYDRNLARANAITNTRTAQMERRFAVMSRSIRNSASTAALSVGTALSGVSAFLGVRQLKRYADGWTTVTRTLAANEQVFGVRLRSAKELNVLAKESRADLDALSKLYVRTAAATRDLGSSEEDVAKATTTVAKALKLGSASASEQASVMLQLSQALQKGKLDGDEFRSVMENAGVIQELLAEKLNVTKGAIVRMAAEGKLKVEQLFGALVDGADKVDRIFERMPTTIGEAFTVLNNSMTEYIGKLDEAQGLTAGFVDGLNGISNNIDAVGNGAIIAGAALLGMFTPALIARAAAFSVALAANPVGLAAAGIAAAATAYQLFGDQLVQVNGGLVSHRDHLSAIIDIVGEQMQPAVEWFERSWASAAALVSEKLLDVEVSMADIQSAVATTVNASIGTFVFFGKAIIAVMKHAPGAIARSFIKMANDVAGAVETMVNNIVGFMNAIPGIEIPEVSFKATLLATKKGEGDLRAALTKAAKSLNRDFLSEFRKGTEALSTEVDRRAMLHASARNVQGDTEGGATGLPARSTPSGGGSSSSSGGKVKKNRFRGLVRSLEEDIAALRLENELLGANALQTEKARTAQELLNAAKREGIKVTPELLGQIDQLSERYAAAVTEAERMKEAFDQIKSTASGVLKGFITDLKDGKNGAEALRNSLDKIADMLIDMAVKQLVTSAFGGLGKGGSGGLLSIFGFAEGGIAAHGRPVALPKFAGGGISNSAAIFGEAGPEAAVPLPNGREIPVDLNMPAANAVRGRTGGEVVVSVSASEQLMADIDNRAEGVVTRRAPQIVGAAVKATDRALPGMLRKTQKRAL